MHSVRSVRQGAAPARCCAAAVCVKCVSPSRRGPCAGHYGVDIGPASEAAFTQALERCKTIFWNGPMGKFEVRRHAATLPLTPPAVCARCVTGAAGWERAALARLERRFNKPRGSVHACAGAGICVGDAGVGQGHGRRHCPRRHHHRRRCGAHALSHASGLCGLCCTACRPPTRTLRHTRMPAEALPLLTHPHVAVLQAATARRLSTRWGWERPFRTYPPAAAPAWSWWRGGLCLASWPWPPRPCPLGCRTRRRGGGGRRPSARCHTMLHPHAVRATQTASHGCGRDVVGAVLCSCRAA